MFALPARRKFHVNLLWPRVRRWFPFFRAINRAAHLFEPPLRAAQSALPLLHRQAGFRFVESEFHLIVHHHNSAFLETNLAGPVGQRLSE